jgi:hypothetical protein
MKKLIILVAIFSLAIVVPSFGDAGGEGGNTGCNGQGNANSPCAGQGGSGGSGGNGGNGGSIDSVIKNKINNKQSAKSNANNEGVIVGGTSVSADDNSTFIAPPPTTPLVGTTSAQVTTPFGGVGFSKDAKHSKLMATIKFINFMKKNDLIEEKRAKEDT